MNRDEFEAMFVAGSKSVVDRIREFKDTHGRAFACIVAFIVGFLAGKFI